MDIISTEQLEKLEKLENIEYKKSDQSFLRLYNKKKILNILKDHGAMSRVELASIANLDRKTITNIVNDLFLENKIKSISLNKNNKGRPREILDRNGDFCYCLGIDISPTHITFVVLNFIGKLIISSSVDIKESTSVDDTIVIIDKLINDTLPKANLSIKDIDSIGISFPGHYDSKTSHITLSESMPLWHGVSIKTIFEDKYNLPTYIGDCSMLMAMAELWFGTGVNCDDFIVFDLGDGIGCGIVLNGKIFTGSGAKAGEIGHTIVKVNGPLCSCGRKGCIEALASGTTIKKSAKEIIKTNPNAILSKLVESNSDTISIKHIVKAANMGDENCIKLLKESGEYIGIGIANAMSLFNPAKVIIGGRLVIDNTILLSSIQETIKEKTIRLIYDDAQILVSTLGKSASAMGASALCLEKYYDTTLI